MIADPLAIGALERCFGGAVPAVLATAGADGVPNVTYLSRAHQVDSERIALSNQFMSKTARNLAVNPRASLLLVDPITHDEYRLALVYERTERRGPVFEKLRADIVALAALSGMQDVFRLRAASIFRVVDIETTTRQLAGAPVTPRPPVDLGTLAELSGRLSRATDLDMLVDAALGGLDQLLGYSHSHLLLADESGGRLYTVASRGFDAETIGAEVAVGEGIIGVAAARCAPVRVGNMVQMAKYSQSMRHQFEIGGGPGDMPAAVLPGVSSRLAVPAIAAGELVGVLVVDSLDPVAFGPADEHALGVVATVLAGAIESVRLLEGDDDASPAPSAERAPAMDAPATAVRYFAADSSVFLGNDYLIKGVAGRILWSLVCCHVADGRVDFTNKELRLDPAIDMPGFKDNLESRLLLLKRRLDERQAPVRIERTGRGRFRLLVSSKLRPETADGSSP